MLQLAEIALRRHWGTSCLRDRLSESTCLDFISKLIISLLHNGSYNNPNTNTLRTTKCCREYHNSCTMAPSPHARPRHAMNSKSGRHKTHYTSCDRAGMGWHGVQPASMTRQGAETKRAMDSANSGKSCEIRCSNSGLIEQSSFSACDAVSLGRWYWTFRSNAVP
jgi:hypothetical protein